jgi:hypothetical protein
MRHHDAEYAALVGIDWSDTKHAVVCTGRGREGG